MVVWVQQDQAKGACEGDLAIVWVQQDQKLPRDAQRDGTKEAMWEKGGTKGVKPL